MDPEKACAKLIPAGAQAQPSAGAASARPGLLPALTRSRSSFPGLIWGTYLPGRATDSPVLGLRPMRGGRKCREKLPKPRISMRSPWVRALLIISSRVLTARSTSSAFRWAWRRASTSINSDLVISGLAPRTAEEPRPGRTRAASQQRLLALVQLLAQQGTQLGGAGGGVVGLVDLGQGLGQLFLVLGADRELQHAALAIHAHELGLDLVADLQVLAGVLDPLLGDIAGAEVALDAALELDRGTAGVDFLDHAGDDAALLGAGHVLADRILLELLDAQRDALALRVHGQHHGLDGVALLEVADHVLAGGVPADVRQVHQAVDTAVQADEDAEVGDRLDLAGHLVALLVQGREGLPRVRGALLDAQGDAAALAVHVQHHDLDL